MRETDFGIVLGVSSVKSDSFEIKSTIQINGRDDISTQPINNSLPEENEMRLYTHWRVGTIPCTPGIIAPPAAAASPPFPFALSPDPEPEATALPVGKANPFELMM